MKENTYILALDEGTTSARAILFDEKLQPVCISQQEIPQIYPQPGWVEQDPLDIYANQYAAMIECVAKSGIEPQNIVSIGITNQRETTIVWNKSTGKPIYPAIVWQCRRTTARCEQLHADGFAEMIARKTGLRPDAYFSATKIEWILNHVEGAREAAARGELLFGTVDTWLLWKLTGGKAHLTDRTNASRTMLFNIETGEWDDELLDLFHIPKTMLPRVCSSAEQFGEVEMMGARIPVCGIAGDQQAALFGQGCFAPGDMKNTYGTGCFLLAHTGGCRVSSAHGLLTTLAANEAGRPLEYALEGSVFVGGAVIQWIRDELHLINEASDSEYFATKVEDNGGVYVVPAFTGLGAPYWDMNARGVITGLSRGAGYKHIIRAALESIAYQTNDIVRAMENDMGKPMTSLKVDGGASSNAFLMQFQADISDIIVIRPSTKEATALGAAALAGLGCGFFASRDELQMRMTESQLYHPQMDRQTREHYLDGWQKAVQACRNL